MTTVQAIDVLNTMLNNEISEVKKTLPRDVMSWLIELMMF